MIAPDQIQTAFIKLLSLHCGADFLEAWRLRREQDFEYQAIGNFQNVAASTAFRRVRKVDATLKLLTSQGETK